MRIRLPRIDSFSFFLGVILSTLLWWILSMLRPAFQQMRENARAKQAEKKEKARAVSAVEERYRQLVLLQAQGSHLAAPLFSLDEILIAPRVLAPPPRVEPGAPVLSEDIVDATVPYLPGWPELAAIYKAPTLTLSQALSGDSDIVLVGQTGMGKTVALANLASSLARRNPEPGLPPDTLPFFIHAADLNLPINKDNPLDSLIEYVAEKSNLLDSPRIPNLIHQAFADKRALVLLDGTDELTPDGLKDVVDFIRAVKKTYPKTRMITTASTEFLDGLVSLNFIPFSLAAWNSEQKTEFIKKWSDLWANYVATETWLQSSEQVDSLLLNGWMISDPNILTPLEITLQVWGAYAGDIRGANSLELIETHMRRISPQNAPREALEMLALQVSLVAQPVFDPHKAREWIKTFEPADATPDQEGEKEETKTKKSGKQDKSVAPSLGLISKMADSGLLAHHRNNRMCFAHPVYLGYLAGKALVSQKPDTILNQPPWIGKFLAMQFLSARGDGSTMVDVLLSQPDRPLARNLLTPARWLRDSSLQAHWRGPLMARLAELIRENGQPLGLRGQALAAFIRSGDPSSAVLFRQLLKEEDPEILQLAALGSGAIQDVKAIDQLAGILNSSSPNVRRASLLALITIGTTASMDVVANALLHGDENLRRTAAEAMSNHPREGHMMLKEAGTMKEDLMVRRAAAYGLGRINEPWAVEMLNNLQLLDDQWIVKNAATEVIEERQKPDPHVPKRLPSPSESPWLIAFAGKQGMGILPDKPPTDVLLLALKSGEEDERLASLSYLRLLPNEGVFGALYQAMYGGNPTLRESVYQTLSEMAARGVTLPDPVQYGVGD
jgi:NACHT domain/HEAT repeats